MLLSHHENVGETHDIKIGNRCFENVVQFRYLGTTITNQNLIQEEIKRRLNSGNACYHSVQNLLSSHLLSKNIKIRIYESIILPVILYGCETWCPTLRMIESRRMRWAPHVTRIGEKRNSYRILVGEPEGKGPLGRQRPRWEDSIKLNLREVRCDGIDWIDRIGNSEGLL
ncbi:hypothetical protein B7P43_G16264 [Cryptotermes secundus]|uniref:Reverse transcriptase domain-containing protein n=1 Tax=Cryptotermes secundus TaxID=105785 RepID=A0A2J7QE47_9NEOP|nr:hypothetical protein B7P43_G16264 [Cryptotermes secundus]